MAALCSEKADGSEAQGPQVKSVLRRCRGRPRLSDTDRAQRRLESRKKYDVRRVYLGESHRLWSDLRRRSCLSDAGLAEYLILLDSTYGEKYQQKYGAQKSIPEQCRNQKKGKKVALTSLKGLVNWYQEHCQTCPHEPELRAVEPTLGLSTSVLWQCEAEHFFVQYISWPAGGASDSEEEDNDREEPERKLVVLAATAGVFKTRTSPRALNQSQLSDTADELESATARVSEVANQMSSTALSQLPGTPAANRLSIPPCHSLVDQAAWEVGVCPERVSTVSESEHAASGQSLGRESFHRDVAIDLKTESTGKDGALAEDYDCVVVTAALMNSLEGSEAVSHVRGGMEESQIETLPKAVAHTPMAATPVQGELYETQALQGVVGSSELSDQPTSLEGSQLIIITGPSYEALTSEGIQLNMGSGNVEEVTCTVIDGVAYNQMCQSGADLRSSITETENITDLSEKQLLEPSEERLDQKDLQPSPHRSSKRSRRGPVIEADGMLKMFHCPYEGCSQVYVAISSFQNHVNLVHRKGRTKVCPHPGCGKKFYLSNHLHRHMIIHSGVRDFICETCGKSFKRKNHLEVHRRTHTGETPLQCEICGYQCRQRASLNWHMKKHTPEAHYNYTCEHCGKRFEKLDSVKFHKLKSHPDKQTT
ncbi:zinc finger protein 653 [Hoplias malabaricus]|uniref:zinc finger protein 653 n=1 Tax=Hoplias malabaricus TaxID=27720 RepID=UPI003462214D